MEHIKNQALPPATGPSKRCWLGWSSRTASRAAGWRPGGWSWARPSTWPCSRPRPGRASSRRTAGGAFPPA